MYRVLGENDVETLLYRSRLLVVIGATGSGRGSVARMIAKHYSFDVVDLTGDSSFPPDAWQTYLAAAQTGRFRTARPRQARRLLVTSNFIEEVSRRVLDASDVTVVTGVLHGDEYGRRVLGRWGFRCRLWDQGMAAIFKKQRFAGLFNLTQFFSLKEKRRRFQGLTPVGMENLREDAMSLMQTEA
jgi:hypothetical protein